MASAVSTSPPRSSPRKQSPVSDWAKAGVDKGRTIVKSRKANDRPKVGVARCNVGTAGDPMFLGSAPSHAGSFATVAVDLVSWWLTVRSAAL